VAAEHQRYLDKLEAEDRFQQAEVSWDVTLRGCLTIQADHAAVWQHEALELIELQRMFRLLDKPKRGYVLGEDMEILLATVGLVGTEEQMESCSAAVLTDDKPGEIHIEPFHQWWKAWRQRGALR
jgi:hypothetical protein